MGPTTSTVVLLCAAAFFAATYATGADGDQLVAKTCDNIMSHGWELLLKQNFCKSTLQLDKRSTAAKHPRDLAIIAIDLAQRAVTNTDAKIDGVLRSGAAGNHSDNLQYCRLNFATVASTIPVCRAMVVNYKPDGDQQQLAPNDYFECVQKLRRGTWKCYKHIQPISRYHNDLSKLEEEAVETWERTQLVAAMLEEMLGIVVDDHFPV